MELLERKVYLLDEPTFGLDMKYSALVAAEIGGLVKRGKTVVLVTHDSWLLFLLNPRVYGLSKGRVVFEGDLRELLARRGLWGELGFLPPRYALKLLEEHGPGEAVSEYSARLGCLHEGLGA